MWRISFALVIVGLFINTAAALSGSGTQQDPWRIESLEDFNEFAADANYWDDYTRLETDVNLAGWTYSTAVIAPDLSNSDPYSSHNGPCFSGVFDGNYHKITNLTIDDSGAGNDYLGLFGYIDDGEVSNLGLESGYVSGDGRVGSLAGLNTGSVSKCYSRGSVTGVYSFGGLIGSNLAGGVVSKCYSTGNVSGDGTLGGLLGFNKGSVLNCYSTCDVNGVGCVGGLVGSIDNGIITNCYSSGSVSGESNVGGLVGFQAGTPPPPPPPPPPPALLDDQRATFHLQNGDLSLSGYVERFSNNRGIINRYSEAKVWGENDISGLMGLETTGGIVTDSFWDIETSGQTTSVGGMGKTTAEMQLQVTFTNAGWDFIGESVNGTSETWRMPADGGYPVLSFFHIDIPFPLVGSGTEGQPYLVNDSNELGMVSWYPVDCYFKLTGNIDLSGINWSAPVVPVFSGCFDGNDHKIGNMQISGDARLGLFGYLKEGGRVRNLGLEGVSVIGTGSYVGGMVGVNVGSVSNCYSAGDVSGTEETIGGLVGHNKDGSVSNCYFTGTVSGTGNNVGGLVGNNDGSVSNCYATGNVSGDWHVGGLLGDNYYGSVSNSYSTSDVSGEEYVGGLVGRNFHGSVSNCYSIADVNGAGEIGGLVGWNRGSVRKSYSTDDVSGNHDIGGLVGCNLLGGSVSNCYSTSDVSGNENVGGLMGYNGKHGSVSNCFWDTDTQTHGVTESIGSNNGTITNVAGIPTAQMQSKSTFTEAGWDFIDEYSNGTSETWQMLFGGGYPVLCFFYADIPVHLSGSGTTIDPYLVGTVEELSMVNWYPKDFCFKLTNDIDLSGINWSVSVVPTFSGCFDGNGHKLSNMQISGDGWLGLFGYLGIDGQVRDLGLEGSSVSGTGDYIGGLGGVNYGTFSNCYSTADVSGDDYVGGLLGANGDWEIQSSTITNCYCTGDVSGHEYAAGLIGINYETVSNCYTNGNVKGSGFIAGGLVGHNYGRVSYSFWDIDTQTHGVNKSVGDNDGTLWFIASRPTSTMQTKNNFTEADWDFVDVWDLTCEGMNYPRFIWQIPPADFLCPHGVDFIDYSFFSNHWQISNCGSTNDCEGADLDFSDKVDGTDLKIFCGLWLEGVGH